MKTHFTAVNTPYSVNGEGDETTICDAMDNEIAQIFAPDTQEQLEIAGLMASVPAMAILLDFARYGVAEMSDGEVVFEGVVYAYDSRNPDWNALLNAIGWDTARAAIAKAIGEAS